MLRVHPKSTKLEAALCLLYNAFSGAGYLEELWTLKAKKNNREEQSFDFMSGTGNGRRGGGSAFHQRSTGEKNKTPTSDFISGFTSDRVSLDN